MAKDMVLVEFLDEFLTVEDVKQLYMELDKYFNDKQYEGVKKQTEEIVLDTKEDDTHPFDGIDGEWLNELEEFLGKAVFKMFEKNCITMGTEPYFGNYKLDLICDAFTWCDSPQGHDYWKNHSEGWREECGEE